MKIRMRRAISEDEKEQRRQEILAAAKVVFARDGYHATTMADVAKLADISYGSLYWYFTSKESLFHALMAQGEQSLRAHVEAAISAGPRKDDLVTLESAVPFRNAVRATFESFESDSALVKLLFRDAQAMGGAIERHLFGIYEGFISDIESIITQAQRDGAIVRAPARMVAFSIAALVGQVALRRAVTDDGLSATEVADYVVQLLLNGLLPREER